MSTNFDVQICNKDKNIKNIFAQEYFLKAEELRQNLKYKESVENYLYSLLMNKENYSSYLGLALSYKNLKNYNKAIINLKKAEKICPLDLKVQKELALCCIIQGDFDTGIKYLINAIKLAPKDIELQMQLALVHEMIEEEDMALKIYQKIIETQPNYLRAYIQKATLYMHLEDYLNSAKIFKTVIKMDADYYRAYLALAICFEKLGNFLAAKRLYKKYISTCKDFCSCNEVTKRIKEINQFRMKKNHNLKLIIQN